jgi:hypothetical protein
MARSTNSLMTTTRRENPNRRGSTLLEPRGYF